MRLLLVIALCLTGCATSPDPLPVQPDAPTSPSVVANLTAKQDIVDGKVAAAVTVAKEANASGKPTAVDSELGVALALLPPASPSDLALARQRSTPTDYESAKKFGRLLMTSLDDAQAKLAADQKEAAKVSAMKDARIVELNSELARVKAEGPRNMVLASAGVCFVSALIMGLIGQYVRSGVAFAIGTFLAALPLLFDSKWFLPSLGGLLLVAVAGELFFIFKPKTASDYEPPSPKV